MQTTIESHRQELFSEVDEFSKKRIMIFRITRQDGSEDHQLVIVDPYMTFNIDLTVQTVVNLHKSISSIISNKQL